MNQYPPYCRTEEDKNIYRKVRSKGWTKWVHSIADIRAIRNGCWFDKKAAERVEKFFLLLHHSKGEWAGQPFVLSAWQRDRIIYPLFGGSVQTDSPLSPGNHFHRQEEWEICSGEWSFSLSPGRGQRTRGKVYNAAVDRSNAMNVFNEAMNMVKASPLLTKRLEIYAGIKRINFPAKQSWYQTLSADAATAEGKNIHGLIYDEIHAAAGRDLYRAPMGGGIGRRQSLMLAITTAGQNAEGSLCFEEYTHAKQVLDGTIEDESYFAFIAEADPKLDLGDKKNWKLANPGLGVSPKIEALQDLWQNAQGSPEKINDFKQYHLNLFVRRADHAIPAEVWDRGGQSFDADELSDQKCYGGLDLGAVSDITALELIFPQKDGSKKVLSWFWVPEDRSRDRGQKKISYLKWIDDDVIKATEGNIVDYDVVRADIVEIASRYDLQALAVDTQFQGKQLASQLLNHHGLPIVDFRCGPFGMAQPTRTFMELVLSGKSTTTTIPYFAGWPAIWS